MPKTKIDEPETSNGNEPPSKKLRQKSGDGDCGADSGEAMSAAEPVTDGGDKCSTSTTNSGEPIVTSSSNEDNSFGSQKEKGETLTSQDDVDSAVSSSTQQVERQDRSGGSHGGEGVQSSGHTLETDVGISEYLGDHKGISAIIKQRYSDFIVNEISLSGAVVHLTSTALPPDDQQEENSPGPSVDPVVSDEVQAQLKQLANNPDTKQTVSIPVGDDKQERQKLHQAIKAAFPTLETKTEEKEGQKVITVMHKNSPGRDARKSGPGQWPASKSKVPYCRFVMYKENKDTMDVISLIAKLLKVKPGLFQYAGTKDRRAKTSQEVTAHKIHPKKLRDLNTFLRNISLGDFRYVEKPLKLGQLAGNQFTIVLRNVLGSEEDLEKGLNSLKTTGFINYFGLQRFGTTSVPTHFIGRALLKEKWEEAVDLILKPRPNTGDSSEKFRTVWAETRDAEQTLDATENRHSIERTILRALCKSPNNFHGAIQSLPRNTRMMYVHSYQSFIWNVVASRHIKTHGMKPVIGDLVLPPGAENTEEDETETPKIHPLVVDEASLSQYTIYDILLPLPGHDIVYPKNDVHTWYKTLLEEDGFDISNMKRRQKDFSLPGAYRTVVVRPKDMEWQMFRYNDFTVPLALSDQDRLNNEPEPVSLPDGKYQAVTVTFTLPPSCYATMALREVLKADTSPAHQSSLNTS